MSFSVTEHFVVAFQNMLFPLAEQEGSRLRNTVQVKSGVVGKRISFDRLGNTVAQTKTVRHGVITASDIPHSRRWATTINKYDAVWFDREDELRMLIDPRDMYTTKIRNSLGRAIDVEIIRAASADATSGEEATTTVSLGSAQKIAAAGAGFTLAKWRNAKQILDTAEVPDDGRHLVIDAKALNADLLADSTLTSSDFNTVKALVDGQVNSFLGFQVHRTQLLEKSGTDWLALAYHESAIGLAINADYRASMDPVPERHNAWLVQADMSFGAVRIEEERLVQIAYNP